MGHFDLVLVLSPKKTLTGFGKQQTSFECNHVGTRPVLLSQVSPRTGRVEGSLDFSSTPLLVVTPVSLYGRTRTEVLSTEINRCVCVGKRWIRIVGLSFTSETSDQNVPPFSFRSSFYPSSHLFNPWFCRLHNFYKP